MYNNRLVKSIVGKVFLGRYLQTDVVQTDFINNLGNPSIQILLKQSEYSELIKSRQAIYSANKLYIKLEILVLLSVCLGLKYEKMPTWQLYVPINESTLFPEKLFQIAQEKCIHKTYYGMVYQSVDDQDYKNILFPFNTNVFSMKQGLFKSKPLKVALSTPWNDIYIKATNNSNDIKAHANLEDNLKVSDMLDFVSLGIFKALERIAKHLMEESKTLMNDQNFSNNIKVAMQVSDCVA